ncbi:MAG: VOC family protein [Pseudomonadota bacterium]
MKFNHINLVVRDPEASAAFYADLLTGAVQTVWLGDSLHLRNDEGVDLAFQQGTPSSAPGAHHGFLAANAAEVDDLLAKLKGEGTRITDDCTEDGFRSIKFRDPDGYEVEVYWEGDWPATSGE